MGDLFQRGRYLQPEGDLGQTRARSAVNWFRMVLTSFVVLAGLLTLAMIVAAALWLAGIVHLPQDLPKSAAL
jgi:uncharacterized protein (DUF983 family)